MNNKLFLGSVLSISILSLSSCSSTNRGMGLGAGAGAAAGAIIGGVTGGSRGAIIGTAAGAALGAGVGHHIDKRRAELAKVAETEKTRDGLLVKLKSDLLFDSGKAQLKPGAIKEIGRLGTILAKYPDDKIKVVGHTDNTGTQALNQRLSRERAVSVVSELQKRGVKESQLSIDGQADSNPVTANDTAEGRARNRRVELNIQVKDMEGKKDKG